jgi:hypothetical protein
MSKRKKSGKHGEFVDEENAVTNNHENHESSDEVDGHDDEVHEHKSGNSEDKRRRRERRKKRREKRHRHRKEIVEDEDHLFAPPETDWKTLVISDEEIKNAKVNYARISVRFHPLLVHDMLLLMVAVLTAPFSRKFANSITRKTSSFKRSLSLRKSPKSKSTKNRLTQRTKRNA